MRAVVLRGGKLEVRETADPVPGPGELLIKPLSAAICASDVHYMDHPNSATRFVWDSDRDTIMGHEFIGEVVGHGPDCSGDFPIGSRATSPAAADSARRRTACDRARSRCARRVRRTHAGIGGAGAHGADGVADDAVAVVDAFAVQEFYAAVPPSGRASCRS